MALGALGVVASGCGSGSSSSDAAPLTDGGATDGAALVPVNIHVVDAIGQPVTGATVFASDGTGAVTGSATTTAAGVATVDHAATGWSVSAATPSGGVLVVTTVVAPAEGADITVPLDVRPGRAHLGTLVVALTNIPSGASHVEVYGPCVGLAQDASHTTATLEVSDACAKLGDQINAVVIALDNEYQTLGAAVSAPITAADSMQTAVDVAAGATQTVLVNATNFPSGGVFLGFDAVGAFVKNGHLYQRPLANPPFGDAASLTVPAGFYDRLIVGFRSPDTAGGYGLFQSVFSGTLGNTPTTLDFAAYPGGVFTTMNFDFAARRLGWTATATVLGTHASVRFRAGAAPGPTAWHFVVAASAASVSLPRLPDALATWDLSTDVTSVDTNVDDVLACPGFDPTTYRVAEHFLTGLTTTDEAVISGVPSYSLDLAAVNFTCLVASGQNTVMAH